MWSWLHCIVAWGLSPGKSRKSIPRLHNWRRNGANGCFRGMPLRDMLDANQILSQFGETDMTFVLVGWTPASDFDKVCSTLKENMGDTLLVQQLPIST